MVQVIPAVALSLLWKRLSATATIIGLLGGIAMVFLNHFVLHWPGYDGFWGLLVNFILVIALNGLFQNQAQRTLQNSKLFQQT